MNVCVGGGWAAGGGQLGCGLSIINHWLTPCLCLFVRAIVVFCFCKIWSVSNEDLTTHFFIGNSIFHLSLELLEKFWKTSLNVV